MLIKRIQPVFCDERGEITDIVSKESIEHATIIHSRRGVIRGNHYHKETQQYLYMMSGKMRAVSQMPGKEERTVMLCTGDLIIHEPEERHAFQMIEDTTWLVLTKGLRGGKDYESDTFRLEIPLIK